MRGNRFIWSLILLVMCLPGAAIPAQAVETNPPAVVFSYPANGAGHICGNIRTLAIAFSEPMGVGASFNHDDQVWDVESVQWSEDRTIFYITRTATPDFLENDRVVSFRLNPPGSTHPFIDNAGNPLATYDLSFTIGPDEQKPEVVSTIPANGATVISPDLDTIVVTFSEAMIEDFDIQNSGSWGRSDHTASPDKRILYMTRENAGTPLPPGETIFVTLNPASGCRFRDLAGNCLDQTTFTFTVGTTGPPPMVVSTSPADGATDVDLNLKSVSITFDTPMKQGHSIYSNFPAYETTWSLDQQTIILSRNDLSTPLAFGMTYTFGLNRDGSTSFRNASGVPLAEHNFSFTTETNYQLLKIPENPAQGFHWPYYLSIPNALRQQTVLLVETNNTGTVSDDWAVHDRAAQNLAKWRSDFAVKLDVPLLVPTFPRPYTNWKIYTHALDRDSLTTTVVGIERIDLQLIAMIDDAKARLAAMGYAAAGKIFINGYSASGSFANRFTLLHPEMIRAAASGSPGGWPTVPVSTWAGETLNYPVGVADLAELVGKPFGLDAFRRVPQYIYVGDQDNNDAVDYTDGFDEADREQIDRLFGDGIPCIVERWPHTEAIFDSVQSRAQFVIYPGVGHSLTEEMFEDLLDFFKQYHPGQFSLSHAIQVLQAVVGIDWQEMPEMVDINGDGRIGMEEAIYALQGLAGLM